jgi:hypothetical protein
LGLNLFGSIKKRSSNNQECKNSNVQNNERREDTEDSEKNEGPKKAGITCKRDSELDFNMI